MSSAILNAIREYDEVVDNGDLTEEEMYQAKCFDGFHEQLLLGKVDFYMGPGVFEKCYKKSAAGMPQRVTGREYGAMGHKGMDIVSPGIAKLLEGKSSAFFTVEGEEYYVDIVEKRVTICLKEER
jgi:hypothetical protein